MPLTRPSRRLEDELHRAEDIGLVLLVAAILVGLLLLTSCAAEPPRPLTQKRDLIYYCSQGVDEACWDAGISTRPVEIKVRR